MSDALIAYHEARARGGPRCRSSKSAPSTSGRPSLSTCSIQGSTPACASSSTESRRMA
jgi:hypothetical protein